MSNTLIRAFHWGEEICKHELAKELQELYFKTKKDLNECWQLVDNDILKNHGYLRIPQNLDLIKKVINDETIDPFIREDAKIINDNKEIKILSEKMINFKNKLNNLMYVRGKKLEEYNPLFSLSKIKEEYIKYHREFLQLNLLQQIIHANNAYPKIKQLLINMEKIYNDVNLPYFWNEDILVRIDKESKNLTEKKILMNYSIIDTLLNLIEQIIFEINFDKITFINREDIADFTIEHKIINSFTMEITSSIDLNDGWIAILQDEDGSNIEILIIVTKEISISNPKIILNGYIYPEDDNMFIKEFLKNIN